MRLVVLDNECIGNIIVKEIGVYKDGQTVGYSFLPPKNSNQHPNIFGVHTISLESIWAVVTKIYWTWRNIEGTETEIFAKRYEKSKFLSEVLETKIINLDDYACPKVQFLIFKDEENDWRCSNYPFRHAKTLHCTERKRIAYGTWTRYFINKL